MKTIELKSPSWRHIRMALSLALMRREPVIIKNGYAFIEKNLDLIPLFNDIKRIVFETGAGMIDVSGDDIIFNPEGLFTVLTILEQINFPLSPKLNSF